MTPDRACWLLQHPLNYAGIDPTLLKPYRHVRAQPSGAILMVVLAVDR